MPTVTETPARPVPASRKRLGREAILQAIQTAAIAEFSAQGFKGATTQDIAARAGLTKPQLHYYIHSKEELYRELLYGVLRGWMGAFTFGADSLSAREVLSSYIRNKVEHALDNPELSRLFTREIMDGGPNLGNYWPMALEKIQMKVDRIERWIQEGQLRPLNAKMFLIHLWAMTQHYADYETQVRVMLRSELQNPDWRSTIAQEITNLVLCGADIAPQDCMHEFTETVP